MIKLERKQFAKTLLAIPLCLILSAYDFISAQLDISVIDMFVQKIMGRVTSYDSSSYILTVQNISFVIIFNFAFCDYIASHFRFGCVYVFSRLRSRWTWYYSRVIELVIYAFLYLVLFFGGTLLICICKSTRAFEITSLRTVAFLLAFSFFIVVNSTLAINLLSIRWGATVSFFAVEAILFFLIALSFFTHDIAWAVSLNPMSCLDLLNKETHIMLFIILNNTVWFLALFYIGRRRVAMYDIALFDPEIN